MTKKTKAPTNNAAESVALPITDTPSWPEALNRVKMDARIRLGLIDIIIDNTIGPRKKAHRDAEHTLICDILAEYVGSDMPLFRRVPDAWMVQTATVYIDVGNKIGCVTLNANGSITLPAHMAHGTYSPSEALRARAKALDAASDQINADKVALRDTLRVTLGLYRTVGAFLREHPSVVALIPAAFLNEAAANASSPNLPADRKALICAIAKAQGVDREECCEEKPVEHAG